MKGNFRYYPTSVGCFAAGDVGGENLKKKNPHVSVSVLISLNSLRFNRTFYMYFGIYTVNL